MKIEEKFKKEKFLQNIIVVWLGALLCSALWGSAFPCIKIGYELWNIQTVDTAGQILFAGSRFTLAGILTVILGSIGSKKWLIPKRESVLPILKLSMFQTVGQYLFFYIGLAHTTGVKASIIGGMNVFLAILAASLIFKQEHLTGRKMLGCLLGFAGIVLVNLSGGGFSFSFSITGEGSIFCSTIAYAFSSVLLKKYSRDENPVILSGYQFIVGGVLMMIVAVLAGGRLPGITAAGIGILLYLAMISAVAYSLWGILLKYNEVSRVTVFGFMNQVFGVFLSALLLKENQAVRTVTIIALIMVCSGIVMVNSRNIDQLKNYEQLKKMID